MSSIRVPHVRRRFALAVGLAAAVSLVISGCAADESVSIDVPAQVEADFPEATAQQLQDAVTHAMAATGSSGAIVGVWAPWSGSLVTGLGVESPGSDVAVTTDMEFRVAQVTRAMTCDVLYEVADRGLVRLNDSVTKWVSGVPDLAEVTLAHLCDSTSGIGSYRSQLSGLFLSNPDRVWNPRELASYGLGQPAVGEPGAAYRNSDAGYVLLGLALERATGQSAQEYLQEYVFEPLDLTSTELPSDASAAASSGAVLNGSYSVRDAAGAINCTEPVDITDLSASSGYTDSGVVSDITDLGRYTQALATGSLLPEGADRLDDPLIVSADSPSWLTTTGGTVLAGSLVGQYGSVPGYLTAAFADPESGLTVVVVLNNSTGGRSFAAYLAWELAAIASKAPAAQGSTAPEAGLPWTAEQYHQAIAAAAICPLPAP